MAQLESNSRICAVREELPTNPSVIRVPAHRLCQLQFSQRIVRPVRPPGPVRWDGWIYHRLLRRDFAGDFSDILSCAATVPSDDDATRWITETFLPRGIRIMSTRRCLVLGLVVSLLGLGGCSSSDKGVDPGPVEELLATAVIGSGGGSLTGGMATVVVPPGAFSGDVEMKIYLTQDANPFAGAGESPLYRLDGLPASFSQPLEIRFPVSPGETGALVAMGEENFSTSVNDLVTGFRMLATTVTDTVATGIVPAAPDPVSGVQASLPVWFVRVGDYLVDDDSAASGPATTVNAGNAAPAAVSHFSVAYPKGKAAEAALMRGYLEAAYTTFTGWPFSFARRTSWPISVTLMDLPPTYTATSFPPAWATILEALSSTWPSWLIPPRPKRPPPMNCSIWARRSTTTATGGPRPGRPRIDTGWTRPARSGARKRPPATPATGRRWRPATR